MGSQTVPLSDLSDAPPNVVHVSTLLDTPPDQQSSRGALVTAAGAKALPGAATLLEEFATNPNVPRAAATVGRVVGGVAPVVAGATHGGVTGTLAGAAAAAKGAWAGGKTGWYTAKLAQNLALPVAKALDAAAPYAQTLSTLSGAQGVNDLAQMAEPDRKDIGFLGIARNVSHADILKDPKAVERVIKATPSIGDAVVALMDLGMAQGDAIRTVMNYRIKAPK